MSVFADSILRILPAVTILEAMPLEKWSESIIVVHLADDPQFAEDIDGIRATNPPAQNCVLDFSSLHFMNSSNIASLLRLRKDFSERGGKLILCSVPSQVWTTFLITGLDKIFQFSENVPTALATIQLKQPGQKDPNHAPDSFSN
jgi:anti-anti-sigma factor